MLFAFTSSESGQSQSLPDSVAVHRAHSQWFDAILAEDTAALSAILSPDVTLAFPAGNTMPRAAFLAYLQSGQLVYDSAQHHELRIRVYDAAAIATGKSTLGYRFKGTAGSERLAYTAVYVRSRSGWRMVAWQSTIARN
jgi:hypothetical protein